MRNLHWIQAILDHVYNEICNCSERSLEECPDLAIRGPLSYLMESSNQCPGSLGECPDFGNKNCSSVNLYQMAQINGHMHEASMKNEIIDITCILCVKGPTHVFHLNISYGEKIFTIPCCGKFTLGVYWVTDRLS